MTNYITTNNGCQGSGTGGRNPPGSYICSTCTFLASLL